jgi:hypothetical protein
MRLRTLGSILKKGRNLGLLFSHGKSYVLILSKMGWAAFWAIVFTNSFGRPGRRIQLVNY